MNEPNPIKYSDLIKPDNSISDLIKQLEGLQKVYSDTAAKLKEQALQVTASLKGVSGATEEGRKAINDAAAATERLTAEEKKVTAAETQNKKALQELKLAQQEQNRIEKLQAKLARATAGSYDALSAQYALNKIRINAMSQAERDAAEKSEQLISKTNELMVTMKRMQAETGQHQLNVGNYQSALDGLGKAMKGLSGNVGQLASGLGVGGLGGSLSGLAAGAGPVGVAVAAVGGFSAALVDGIGTARDYEKAVSTLQSITGMTKDAMSALTDQARQLGATTTYTATEVIQLQTELAKLGYGEQDILNMTDSVLYFAQATGASLADASSMTGAALRMFQKDTTHTQEFTDKLAASTTKSALSFSYLDTALSIVSPVANAFGFQIEDVLALLGQLANAGFDASSAATATRNILLNLADANGDLAKSIGHPVKNLDELMQGLQQLNAEGVDLATSLELSDKRSVAAFNTFLRGAEDVTALRDALNDCNGTAEEMSHVMGDNLDGDIKSLGSAWDDFMLEINDGQGILRDIVQWLTNVIREIASAYKELKEYFTDLWEKSESFRAVVVTLFTVVETNLDILFTTIKNLSKAVWGLGELIVGAFSLDWELIKDGWNTASNAIIDQVKEVATTVVDNVQEAANKINNTDATLLVKVATIEPSGGQPTATATETKGGTGQGEGGKKGMNIKRLNGKEYDLDVEEEKEDYEKALKKYQEAQKKLAAEREKAQKKAEQDAEKAYRAELSARRSAEDAQLALIEDSWQQKTIKTNLQYSRQIEDLKHTLETQKDLTKNARESINATIAALEQKQTNEIIKIEEERYAKELELQKKAIELKLQTVKEGSEEEKNLLLQQNEIAKEIAMLKAEPGTEADVAASFDIKAGEISDKFLQGQLKIFDEQQDLAQSEFDLLKTTEMQKTKFRLTAERDRLQKVLAINEQAANKMSDAEVETIKNTIARINQEIENQRGDNIYDILGLNVSDEQKEVIQTSTDFAMQQLTDIFDAYTAEADAKVAAADKEVDSAQKALDKEIELQQKGYANNVALAQKELDNAKANQEKALKQQEKAQKRQAALQTLQQAGDLVTASAKIWGQLGFPYAIPAIAVMWASFAASKIKANQATKSEKYGEGTVEMLHGGSHQSGNDIDLGRKPDGTRRRAEGGEFFAVINKRNSRKYRHQIPALINAINTGTLEQQLLSEGDSITAALVNDSPDIADLAADVHAIRKANEMQRYTEDGAVVEVYKNCTRRIVKR